MPSSKYRNAHRNYVIFPDVRTYIDVVILIKARSHLLALMLYIVASKVFELLSATAAVFSLEMRSAAPCTKDPASH